MAAKVDRSWVQQRADYYVKEQNRRLGALSTVALPSPAEAGSSPIISAPRKRGRPRKTNPGG